MKTNFKMNILSLFVLCSLFVSGIVLINRDVADRKVCEMNKKFYFHGKCF